MTDVFISYAKADSDIADQIATKLQQNNVSVFMDRESLVSGESSSQKTINELEHSRVVFVILTKNSARSRWVSHDLAHALRAGADKIIVPVLVGEGSKENPVWPLVADRTSIDAGEEFDSSDLRKLDPLIKRFSAMKKGSAAEAAIKYDVFISYTAEDVAIASDLRKKLEDRGLTCFMAEKDTDSDSESRQSMGEALVASNCILMVLTPRSINRSWVLLEAGAAWALNKTVITAVAFVEVPELPEMIRNSQVQKIESSSQIQLLVDELAGPLATQ